MVARCGKVRRPSQQKIKLGRLLPTETNRPYWPLRGPIGMPRGPRVGPGGPNLDFVGGWKVRKSWSPGPTGPTTRRAPPSQCDCREFGPRNSRYVRLKARNDFQSRPRAESRRGHFGTCLENPRAHFGGFTLLKIPNPQGQGPPYPGAQTHVI